MADAAVTPMIAEQDIVQNYLDSLLRAGTEIGTETGAPSPGLKSPAVQSDAISSLEGSTMRTASPAARAVIPEVAIPSQAMDLDVPSPPTPGVRTATPEAVAPGQGAELKTLSPVRTTPKSAFACLLFEVDGMGMAAPLHELGGISRIDEKLQTVAGQAPWFMGLLRWNGRNIRVVDTTRWLMPERAPGKSGDYQSIIVLGDSNWALAVNAAEQSIRLEPGQVSWRDSDAKGRPWLAGTVLDKLYSLLDVAVLIELLEHSAASDNADDAIVSRIATADRH